MLLFFLILLPGLAINLEQMHRSSLCDVACQIEETTAEEWRRVMAINVDGAFFMTQACLVALD